MGIKVEVTPVLELLERKTALFAEYERVTDDMLKCAIDEMLECVSSRQALAHEIDGVDRELSVYYDRAEEDVLRRVVLNRVEWDDCPAELKDVFMAGQRLMACFGRIAQKEAETVNYVEAQKEDLLKLIKDQNTGMTARAAKYYGTVRQSEENFTFFDNKY